MAPQLPDNLARVLQPVFNLLAPDDAMPALALNGAADRPATDHPALCAAIEQALAHPEMADRPELAAGLWLFADELDRSHAISQTIHSPTGSFWHAIMHRREADFDNARHWYRKVGRHPAMHRIDPAGGGAGAGTDIGRYDPLEFVDRTQRAYRRGEKNQPELVSLQRREWQALFEWCAEQQ